jgi:CBS domain-containing protein
MQAKDVMTTRVITVEPDTSVEDVAKVLLDRRISAAPVVDDQGGLVGIVSEGDLMRRPESDTESLRSWWLAFLELPEEDTRRFIKTHGRHARDVMTRNVTTVTEDCPLEQIATILEEQHIKRVPITREGRLVGIVSRADLLRGLAATKPATKPSADDRAIREAVEEAIRKHTGLDDILIAVTVVDGVVQLWGGVEEPSHKDAARIAAENVPGLVSVEDRIRLLRPSVRATLWV